MPNQGNRSNGSKSNSGRGQTGDPLKKKAASQKENAERSDKKHGDHAKDRKGDTGRTSSEGRKSASGGS